MDIVELQSLIGSCKNFAEKKIVDSIKNGEDTETIRYWVGYKDGLDAILKKMKEQ